MSCYYLDYIKHFIDIYWTFFYIALDKNFIAKIVDIVLLSSSSSASQTKWKQMTQGTEE